MRTAALVLGIVGGVFGILAGLLAMLVGGIGSAFEADGSGSVVGLGFAAIMLGVLGIIGGSLSNRSPGASAVLQAIAGIVGFLAVSLFWVLAGVLLIAGAFLALLSRRSNRQQGDDSQQVESVDKPVETPVQ